MPFFSLAVVFSITVEVAGMLWILEREGRRLLSSSSSWWDLGRDRQGDDTDKRRDRGRFSKRTGSGLSLGSATSAAMGSSVRGRTSEAVRREVCAWYIEWLSASSSCRI